MNATCEPQPADLAVRPARRAGMSVAEPIASGRLETKMATSSPTLTPSPAAIPMPSTVCSGIPIQERAERERRALPRHARPARLSA